MARVRVLVYRDQSDEVIEDFVVEHPDKNSSRVAQDMIFALSKDGTTVTFTDELISRGESV